jgi:hypothetical protein|tara:strand:+ start:2181 stop:2327 length:147 start_codon:yes stop_codon:yes gene_type:complete
MSFEMFWFEWFLSLVQSVWQGEQCGTNGGTIKILSGCFLFGSYLIRNK